MAKKSRLRILHVWDQAGVAGCLAKYQRKRGHIAHVIIRDGFDGLGINKYYGSILTDCASRQVETDLVYRKYLSLPAPLKRLAKRIAKVNKALRFYITAMRYAKNYDILHIHSLYAVVFFVPFKKKILEFHGDDVRFCPSKRSRIDGLQTRIFLKLASKLGMYLLVSTPDLHREVPNAIWLPNPVDTELFKPGALSASNLALYSSMWYEPSKRAKKIAQDLDLTLYILERRETADLIRYPEMPQFLGKFSHYIDRGAIPSLSKTALEALSVGLKVVAWDGRIIQGLPSRHLPENVVKETEWIYRRKLFVDTD
jgi:hypothetical protein